MTDQPEAQKSGAPCPTPTAHKRLDEAHHLWHQCLDNYQDPDGFRIYLNSCIQALRNVSWVLQKEKRLIPGFDEWYPVWRQRMRVDPVMAWVVRSRNRIVKEGDLETESRAIARVITSYAEAAEEVERGLGFVRRTPAVDDEAAVDVPEAGTEPSQVRTLSAPPRFTLPQILLMIAGANIPLRILQQSTLTLERRWVDRALPDFELLDAMAHAFGVLELMISDVHDRMGVEHGIVLDHDGSLLPVRDDGRYPCMVTSRAIRTIALSLDDLHVETGGKVWQMEFDPEVAEKSLKRYGTIPTPPSSPKSPVDFVPSFTEIGSQILRKDKGHGWFIYYYRGPQRVHAQTLMARNNADKRHIAQQVAELASINDIDGVIVVGEAWHSPMRYDEQGAPIPPSEHPDKSEVLIVHAEDAYGRIRSVHVPFTRRRGRRTLVHEVVDLSNVGPTSYQFLEPVRAVWRQRYGAPETAGTQPS